MNGSEAMRSGPTAAAGPHQPEGLTREEARRRLIRDGPNLLPAPSGPPLVRELLRQLLHFFAIMLWGAAALAFLAGLPELGVAIIAVVLLNAGFAFVQEYRAERAAQRLRDLLPRRVVVVRDGVRVEIDTTELVLGDLVLLAAGDRVSADLEATESHGLWIDTSTLTGESVPSPIEVGDRLFAGTFITEGEGAAVVVAVGGATRLAGIARLSQAGERPTPPLALELRRLVRTISVIAIGVGVGFFAVSTLIGSAAAEGVVFAIGVTVALVPEALLPTVTLSLAIGAQRMATRQALVRRLESVETLGSTTFICTDKTGTLTMNEMSAVEVWTPAGQASVRGRGYEPWGDIETTGPAAAHALREAALVAVRCSTGHVVEDRGRWTPLGDPTEVALDVLARRVGADVPGDLVWAPELRRFPFDPRRRRMSVVAGQRVLVKGAPDAVLRLCSSPEGVDRALAEMTERGLRVIAVAFRDLHGAPPPTSAGEAERDLELIALIALEDPPRAGAAEAIAACRVAGIAVGMVTGDHPVTARAIATEVGLLLPGTPVLVGADLPADDEALGELVDRDGIVIGRVEPEDKLRIARALRRRGHVVAMTGDGVNDGPALHEANIGVAMGRSGTDVAREAADLVLLDDEFATIVTAVEEGRAIFANARRFLTYHLTDNVAELTPLLVWALSGGTFPLALGVLQILALDLGTDTLSAVALGAEPAEPRTLERLPTRGRLLDRGVARRAFAILGPVEAFMGMAAFLASLLARGWRPGDPFPTGAPLLAASGATFMAVVIGQTANAFACRSTTTWPGALGWLTNRLLVVGASIELALSLGFVLISPVADLLRHAAPSLVGWGVALLAGPVVLAVDALDKAIRGDAAAPGKA